MDANKLTAFIAGILISLGALYVERSEIHFAWIAVIFLPVVLIFVIGFQPWRAWATGERASLSWPNSDEDKQVMRAAWIRMFICFLGAIVAGVFNNIITG